MDPAGTHAPTVDEVAAEIRLVVGRVRSPAGLGELELPALDQLAGGERDVVPAMIIEAMQRIDNEQYREFLALLLPFPFTPAAPWEQLGPNRRSDGRGERASREAFGLSWDACNRPGQLLDGRSRRDWAERFLAESLLARTGSTVVPTRAPADALDEAAAEPPVPGDGERGGRTDRRPPLLLVLGAAALVLAVGATIVVLGSRDRSSSAASPTTERADGGGAAEVGGVSASQTERISCASIGALGATASQEPDAAQLTEQLIDLYRTLPEDVGCPSEPAFIWGELLVQELEGDEPGLPGAMLVERASGASTYLTPAAYARYRTLGSGDGSVAQSLGGMPSEVTTFPDGHQEVALSKGVLFVAETAGAPFFWIAADFVELWRASPQLGRPVGNPMPSLVQDYQYGYGQLYQKDTEPTLTLLDDPSAELPAVQALERTVLRQPDGTAWWVGPDGRRYWIATGAVWECLVDGRDEEVAQVRGYAIATLPYGGHAECPAE